MGQGLGRRPGDAHRGRPVRPPARPPAGARRRLPGRRARGRDGRGLRLLPARSRWRRAIDRHRDARPARADPRRPPPSGRRYRPRDGSRRRGADPPLLRRPGGLGALAAAGIPARPRHRRDPARTSGGHRRDPRRARHHRVGRDVRRMRGELARDHPHAPSDSSPRKVGRTPSERDCPSSRPCPTRERRRRAAALFPVLRGLASTDRTQVGHFTDTRRRPRLPRA